MRIFGVLLASASLFACAPETPAASSESEGQPVAASLSYAGADFGADRAAMLAHGERISGLMGCQGCHGADLQGGPTGIGVTFNAPNLSLLLPTYSDAELARAVQGGIAKDGRELWAIMPSAMYSQLSERDFAALVAYLRSFEPGGEMASPFVPDADLGAAFEEGQVDMAPAEVAKMRSSGGPIDLGTEHAFGRYVAATSCTECHGERLQGYEGFSPNLDLAGVYEREELRRLLSEGVGKTREDLGLMSAMGKFRFSQFTPEERDALIDYLLARAEANTQ